jgi:hypothetical protein
MSKNVPDLAKRFFGFPDFHYYPLPMVSSPFSDAPVKAPIPTENPDLLTMANYGSSNLYIKNGESPHVISLDKSNGRGNTIIPDGNLGSRRLRGIGASERSLVWASRSV